LKAAGIAPNFSPVCAVGAFGTHCRRSGIHKSAWFDGHHRLPIIPTHQSLGAAGTGGRTIAMVPALCCPKHNLSAAFLVPPFFMSAGVTGNGEKEQR
jgi:hypothetical protein